MNGSFLATDLAELRRDFDQAFAKLPATAAEDTERLLSIRIEGDFYALRLLDISELLIQSQMIPIPSRNSSLLGIAGSKGRIVPVFSLALLMGYSQTEENCRWLIICGNTQPVGLAFSTFERFFCAPRSTISTIHEANKNYSRQVMRDGMTAHLIIDIQSLLSQIQHKE